MTVKIVGVEIQGLADTGSQISTVTKEVFDDMLKAGLEPTPDSVNRIFNVRSSNGLPLPYTNYFICDLEHDGHIAKDCGFLVIETTETRTPALIGTNVLEKIPGLMEKLKDCGITPNPWKFPAPECHEQSSKLVRVSGETEISAGTVTYVKMRGRNKSGRMEFEPLSTLQEGLFIPYGVTCSKNFVVPIMNLTDKDVLLKNNQKIGLLRPAELIPPVVSVSCQAGDLVISTDPVPSSAVADPEVDWKIKFESEIEAACESFPGTEQQKAKFAQVLREFCHVFANSEEDLGKVDTVHHHIPTTDDRPVQLPYRRVPPAMMRELREHLDLLLKQGIIRESESSYASPVVLVRKKDGRLRLCCDFRVLNEKTVRDAHPLPRIQESMDSIAGSKFFTTLDLKSAYNQIPVAEEDIHKTAFTTPYGLYEHIRMPFGLKNAPSCFQRLMNSVLRRELYELALCYLDDILVYGKTVEEETERVRTVLQRLSEYRLKLDLRKCSFFKEKVRYLGFEVSAEGIAPDSSKIEAVQKWPEPESLKELRHYLGFTAFYRRYVCEYTQKAKPLHRLVGELSKLYPGKRKRNSVLLGEKWSADCRESFKRLRDSLIEAPVLAYPRYGEDCILETDSSDKGLGAVLYQMQDGVKRIIAFASRGLRGGESNKSNYSSKKLELLALKWACEHFREILMGSHFVVFTDNNPLTYIKTTKNLPALEQRWLNTLASFDFELKFKRGAANVGADALSRTRYDGQPCLSSEEVDSCLTSATPGTPLDPRLIQAATEACKEVLEVDEVTALDDKPASSMPTIEPKDMAKLQLQDPVIQRIIHYRTLGRRPNFRERANEEKSTLQLLRQWDRIVEQENGPLFRKISDSRGDTVYQLLLPACLQADVLRSLHDDAGHQAAERTENLIRARCYWPTMARDIAAYIARCQRCNQAKLPYHQVKTPLGRLVASRPLECLAIDYTLLERSSDGKENVLIMTDVFSKFTQAVATKDQKASTVAKVLVHDFFFKFGVPLRIHSDQGRNFEGKVIKELCKLFGIKKSATTSYHPESNAIVERFNRTLHSMLSTLEKEKKRSWSKHLLEVVHCYNVTPHSSTGYSPFYLLFGRECRMAIDLTLGTKPDQAEGMDWIVTLQERLTSAYKLAKAKIDQEADRRKKMHDRTAKSHTLKPGTVVRIRKRVLGRSKIGDAWGSRLFRVLRRQGENDVYVIEPCDGLGDEKTLNRRELKPAEAPDWLPQLPSDQREAESAESLPTSATRRTREPSSSNRTGDDSDDEPAEVRVEILRRGNADAEVPDVDVPVADVPDTDAADADAGDPAPASVAEEEEERGQSSGADDDDDTSSDESQSEPEVEDTPDVQRRTSSRSNKGVNSNPGREPRSAIRR